MTPEQLENILEAALLVAAKPMKLSQLEAVFEHDEDKPERQDIVDVLQALQVRYETRGIDLVEVASGWRLQSRQELSPWIANLFQEKSPRYSRALLETLVLVAYRQPITRGEIEDVRGVAVSTNIIRTLLDRNWVKVVGHRDVPGRPAIYGTTREFLDYFSLQKVGDLPTLSEIKELEEIAPELAREVAMLESEDEEGQGEGQTSDQAESGHNADASADASSHESPDESPDESGAAERLEADAEAPDNDEQNVADAELASADDQIEDDSQVAVDDNDLAASDLAAEDVAAEDIVAEGPVAEDLAVADDLAVQKQDGAELVEQSDDDNGDILQVLSDDDLDSQNMVSVAADESVSPEVDHSNDSLEAGGDQISDTEDDQEGNNPAPESLGETPVDLDLSSVVDDDMPDIRDATIDAMSGDNRYDSQRLH